MDETPEGKKEKTPATETTTIERRFRTFTPRSLNNVSHFLGILTRPRCRRQPVHGSLRNTRISSSLVIITATLVIIMFITFVKCGKEKS